MSINPRKSANACEVSGGKVGQPFHECNANCDDRCKDHVVQHGQHCCSTTQAASLYGSNDGERLTTAKTI